jgi:hypothetical protein
LIAAIMTKKSREQTYGASIRAAAECRDARKAADRFACEASHMRMLGYKGLAQASPTLADALDAGNGYLEICVFQTTPKPPDSECKPPRPRRSCRVLTRTTENAADFWFGSNSGLPRRNSISHIR